jgi:hypothetical protein
MQKQGCTVGVNYAAIWLYFAGNYAEFRLCLVEIGRRNHYASVIDVMVLEFT